MSYLKTFQEETLVEPEQEQEQEPEPEQEPEQEQEQDLPTALPGWSRPSVNSEDQL
jgi:hypothetical protein